ncbi:MAG TPA: phenylphosphate carboxylase subunit beta [Syntrophorhabdaceae bacterium]|jgi:4-hydroxy-3-polyprenylbenzoate decarboxylase
MDLRDFIDLCEKEGQLRRIRTEVDWDLEVSHISKLVEEKGGPALLFEHVKGYESPLFMGAFATTQRLGLMLGKGPGLSMVELSGAWVNMAVQDLVPAQEREEGPIFENILDGEKADVLAFPSPRFYELDGGRYFGTTVFLVMEDPETGAVNLGTYRMQVLDSKTVGVQILKGKRGGVILEKYRKMGRKMPAAAIIGGDPLLLLGGAAMVAGASEYDVVGSLRGAPVNIVRGRLSGLPIPADAEIVLEGEIDPERLREEGPFGEFIGYYTDEILKPIPKPALEVKRIYHRNNPVLWETSAGRPVTDVHMLLSFTQSATLWTELTRMEIPGIKSVYMPPEAAGRFWTIVSVEQLYPGHAEQVAQAIVATNTASYCCKGIIIVDHDIAADDLSRVWWALGARFNPARGTQIINRGRATPLDPALEPGSDKSITSRIILNATIPYEWKEKLTEIKLTESVLEKIRARWTEYGIER